MSEKTMPSPLERRSFIYRITGGLAAFAGVMAGGAATTFAPKAAAASFQPELHEKDDWMDKIPGKHRVVFDTTTPDVLGDALAFANNYFRTNKNDYGIQNSDLAVIIIMRHRATGFAYSDAMWAKYGTYMSKRAMFTDPKTNEAPKINLFNVAGDYNPPLANRGNTVDSLLKLGVHLGVCSTATRGMATAIAEGTGAKADDIAKELVANLYNPTVSHMVPAGIVAVTRAQERGYSVIGA
jgi:intracellular sulfur oxidation DsrE/DsrF family protein